MEIKLRELTIGDVARGYADNAEEGVTGYNGKLDIRPAYQREFVYNEKQRNAVIHTIMRGFPLNTMYWSRNADGTFELLDGQQRTISFCQFVNNDFSVKDPHDGHDIYFDNMPEDDQIRFLSYKLFVYVCEGSDTERLDWFRTINIAGERLTEQELLNANYTGPWLSHAKRLFSKPNCVAYLKASKWVKDSPIRQEYLETALEWINGGNAGEYMARHQFDDNADELWRHFQNVIDWASSVFTTYRKELCGLDWGRLYATYGQNGYDADAVELKVKELMANDEVTDKKGVFEYVLSGCDERLARKLSKRTFSSADKRTAYERQGGICPKCGEWHDFSDMDGDHIVPWWRGGLTVLDNLQMLCRACNSGKGGKAD